MRVLHHGYSSERTDLDEFDLLEDSSIEDELGIKELTDIPSEAKLDDIDYTGPDDI